MRIGPLPRRMGLGRRTRLTSKVWFTLANGVMTEVFYPTLDVPNVQTLQFQSINDGKMEKRARRYDSST